MNEDFPYIPVVMWEIFMPSMTGPIDEIRYHEIFETKLL